MSKLIEIILRIVDQATAPLTKVDTAVKQVTTNIDKVNKATNKMNFGFLSLIFGGMALQRIFGGFLTTVFNSYKEVTQGNDILSKKVLEVNAAFEFLKFSIFNTLSQSPLFFILVDAVVSLVNGFSEFVNMHPQLTIFGMALAGVAAVIGSVAMGAGLVWQTAMLVGAFKDFFALKFLGSALAGSSGLGGLSTAIGVPAAGNVAATGLLGRIALLDAALAAVFLYSATKLVAWIIRMQDEFIKVRDLAIEVGKEFLKLGLDAPQAARFVLGAVGMETIAGGEMEARMRQQFIDASKAKESTNFIGPQDINQGTLRENEARLWQQIADNIASMNTSLLSLKDSGTVSK